MNIRKLSISSLLDFVAIANCGSINKAALELNISPSSLTRSIKRMENNLGVELFTRTPGGIQLTECGDFPLYTRAGDGASAEQVDLVRAFADCLKMTGPDHDTIV